MEYAPDLLTITEADSSTLPGRRLHYRQPIVNLAYINLDNSNGGILRDLSEGGVAIQAVTPLYLNQTVHLRFELRPRLRIETRGRIAWTDTRGQAGVEFINLPSRSRRSLKEWIFTQLLERARQVSEMGFTFVGTPGADLAFSSAPHTPIRLKNAEITPLHSFDAVEQSDTLRLRWCPVAISSNALARTTDSLILLSAILLFFVVAMSLTHTFPKWPWALAFTAAVAGLITTAYWLLFEIWLGLTPGEHLARIAGGDSELLEDERPRFR